MKRFYLKSAVALTLTALALGVGAKEWTAVKDRPAEKQTVKTWKNPRTKLPIYANPGMDANEEGIARLPRKQAAPQATRSAEEPRGTFTCVVPEHTQSQTEEDAYYGRIDARTGRLTQIYKGAQFCSFDRDFQTSLIRNGHLYTPNWISSAGSLIYWSDTDLSTGEEVDLIDFHGDNLGYSYNMTLDTDNDIIYSLSYDLGTGSPNIISIIDPNTFTCQYQDQFFGKGFFAAICYCPADKKIYIFNNDNQVFEYNPKTKNVSICAELELMEFLFEQDTPGLLCYSPKDECFVALYNDRLNECFTLYYINPEDWSVTQGAQVFTGHKPRITSLHCLDEYAVNDAPEMPASIKTSFSGSNATGTYTFTVPSLLYSGVQIPSTASVHTVITLDGKVIVDDNFAPGYTDTREITVTDGEHNIAITCDLGANLVGPTNNTTFYAGYDSPMPPTNLVLKDNVLTWKAPGSIGAHGGYVNPAHFSYNVYVDGELLTTRGGVTECTYTLKDPDKQTRCTIEVKCTGDRLMTSEPAVLSTVWGKALSLPCALAPTVADASLCEIVKVNDQGSPWAYWTDNSGAYKDYISTGKYAGFRAAIGYFVDADEWLILPKMAFNTPEKLYRFTFDVGGIYTGTTREDFEVWIGDMPNVKSMTRRIFNREYHPCAFLPAEVPVDFTVPEAGNYYLAIRYKSTKARDGKGMTVTNFQVRALEASSSVPVEPTNIKVEPDETGLLGYFVTATAPTTDAMGKPIPAGTKVKIYSSCGMEADYIETTPGGTISDLWTTANRNGFNQVFIWAETENGAGNIVCKRVYAGVDTPFSPSNIRQVVSNDNYSMDILWDAPSSKGVNGAFVDVPALEYVVYQRSGVTFAERGSVTGKTQCLFDPGEANQYNWHIGVGSRNQIGASTDIEVISEVLGRPNSIPQIEDFGTTTFNYNPITTMVRDEFEGTNWQNVSMAGSYAYDGSPVFEKGGGLIAVNEAFLPQRAGVIFPKFRSDDTDGNPVIFQMRVWDYKLAPRMYLMGRSAADQTVKQIGEFQLDRTSPGKWATPTIELPAEYQNQPWVQLRVYADMPGISDDQVVLIDGYKVYVDVDKDAKAASVVGPTMLSTGNVGDWNVTVSNAGLEKISNVKVTTRLINAEGRVCQMLQKTISALTPGSTWENTVKFEFQPDFGIGLFKVEAEVELDGDEMSNNNKISTEVVVLEPQLPVVKDFTGTRSDDAQTAHLTWTEPDLTYGSYLDFETLRPFLPTDMIGTWKNITLNPDRSSFDLEGLSWPGSQEPQAWAVIDAEQLNLMGDSRFCPHSGKQYLMARALHYEFGVEEAVQSSAWLISPEIVGGTDLSFWMTTANSSNPETVCIYYSTTDDDLGETVVPGPGGRDTGSTCGSFKWLRNFTKTGSAAWELCEVTLPEDAKYVAIVYRSWDEIAAGIDDIICTPRTLDRWTLDHYSLWRTTDGDWATYEPVNTDIRANSYDDATFGDRNRSYYLMTYVRTEDGVYQGPRSSAAKVFSTDVNELEAAQAVIGAKGEIIIRGFNGQTAALYSADGKYLRSAAIDGDASTLKADAGVYLVKVGATVAKVLVK